MPPRKIGILGGTFDPVHWGHVRPAAFARDFLDLERVLLVPSAAPVHRPTHGPAPAHHRLAMCRLAAAREPRLEASPIEVARPEPSYTVLTLELLRGGLGPETELVLLVGDDNLPLLHTWRRIEDVLRLSTVTPVPRPVAGRQDLSACRAALGAERVAEILGRRVPGPLVPISATEVRRRVRAGRTIEGLVPGTVAAYIAGHGLYRGEKA